MPVFLVIYTLILNYNNKIFFSLVTTKKRLTKSLEKPRINYKPNISKILIEIIISTTNPGIFCAKR